MKLHVKTLLGRLFPINVDNTTAITIAQLKDIIHTQVPIIPREGQTLVYAGKELTDDQTVEAVSLGEKGFVVVYIASKLNIFQDPVLPAPRPTIIAEAPLYTSQSADLSKSDENTDNSVTASTGEKTDTEMDLETSDSTSPSISLSEDALKELVGSLIGALSPPRRRPSGGRISVPGEDAASENDSERSSAEDDLGSIHIDASSLRQLQDMGFSESRARKALLLHRMNAQNAMEWLLIHNEDPDIDDPLSPDQIRTLLAASLLPDEDNIRQLQEMGFDRESVTVALRANRNSQEAALAWLLSRGEDGGGEFEGSFDAYDEGDDDADGDGEDEGNLVSMLMNHPMFKTTLGDPRVIAALTRVAENPERAAELVSDPTIAPLLLRLQSLIQAAASGDLEEDVEGDGDEDADGDEDEDADADVFEEVD